MRQLRDEVSALERHRLVTAARLVASRLREGIELLRSRIGEAFPKAVPLMDELERTIQGFIERLEEQYQNRFEQLRSAELRERLFATDGEGGAAGRAWFAMAAALMLSESEIVPEVWEQQSRELVNDEGLVLAERAGAGGARPDAHAERLWVHAVARVPALVPIAAVSILDARATQAGPADQDEGGPVSEPNALKGALSGLSPDVLCTALFLALCRLVLERLRHVVRWAAELPDTPGCLRRSWTDSPPTSATC